MSGGSGIGRGGAAASGSVAGVSGVEDAGSGLGTEAAGDAAWRVDWLALIAPATTIAAAAPPTATHLTRANSSRHSAPWANLSKPMTAVSVAAVPAKTAVARRADSVAKVIAGTPAFAAPTSAEVL